MNILLPDFSSCSFCHQPLTPPCDIHPGEKFPTGVEGVQAKQRWRLPPLAQALRACGVKVRPSPSQAKRLLASPYPYPRPYSLAPTPRASGAEPIVGILLCPDCGLKHWQEASSWSGHLPSSLLQTSRKSKRPSCFPPPHPPSPIPVPLLCPAPALISSLAFPLPLFSKAEATPSSSQLFLLPDPSFLPQVLL